MRSFSRGPDSIPCIWIVLKIWRFRYTKQLRDWARLTLEKFLRLDLVIITWEVLVTIYWRHRQSGRRPMGDTHSGPSLPWFGTPYLRITGTRWPWMNLKNSLGLGPVSNVNVIYVDLMCHLVNDFIFLFLLSGFISLYSFLCMWLSPIVFYFVLHALFCISFI